MYSCMYSVPRYSNLLVYVTTTRTYEAYDDAIAYLYTFSLLRYILTSYTKPET